MTCEQRTPMHRQGRYPGGDSDQENRALSIPQRQQLLMGRGNSRSVAENIALTSERGQLRFRRNEAEENVQQLSTRYGLSISPWVKVWQHSVGLQQRVEILIALSAEARILILDEPTAVLSPQEITELFTILRRLKSDGHSIIFISHKLKEVMEISESDYRVASRQKGRDDEGR